LPVTVRSLELLDIPHCERVLRSLPDWFGIEEANRRYIRDLETMPAYVAELGGEICGFAAVHRRFPTSAELHIIAVEPNHHREGAGRALLDAVEADLLADGVLILQVKTLGPSREDEGYANTRHFYEAMGFQPLEETTALWGAENPTLIMVKVLA
jgi:N-acetylglutamate synthase-like GNAT family acetyltransferase